MVTSTLPSALNFFLGELGCLHSMAECLLVGVKLWIHVSSPVTTRRRQL
jgi:hypothetical protein